MNPYVRIRNKFQLVRGDLRNLLKGDLVIHGAISEEHAKAACALYEKGRIDAIVAEYDHTTNKRLRGFPCLTIFASGVSMQSKGA